VCAVHCVQLLHTILHRTADNFPSFPPDNHHCSDDVYLRERGRDPRGKRMNTACAPRACVMWRMQIRVATVDNDAHRGNGEECCQLAWSHSACLYGGYARTVISALNSTPLYREREESDRKSVSTSAACSNCSLYAAHWLLLCYSLAWLQQRHDNGGVSFISFHFNKQQRAKRPLICC